MPAKSAATSLEKHLQKSLGKLIDIETVNNEVTLVIKDSKNLIRVAEFLHQDKKCQFEELIDICGVDYLHYGASEWQTSTATASGFSRAKSTLSAAQSTWQKPRFAVVYHLLSVSNNQRVRLQVFLSEDKLEVATVTAIWSGANWYEREAFDLFGIIFVGHPDLRRILTDYGFRGHPFRKDFPLVGEVEMRYDAKLGKCIYEPVSIEPRVGVPKVIRKDRGYQDTQGDK